MTNVELRAEDYPTTADIELNSVRVDQRITIKPKVYERTGQEDPRGSAYRSTRVQIFLITGKATQAEKDAIEKASAEWWRIEGTKNGRIRFKWSDNKGDGSVAGSYYNCAIQKTDFTQEAAHEKYDYIIELIKLVMF